MKKNLILIIIIIILAVIIGIYFLSNYIRYSSTKPINLQRPMIQVNESLSQSEGVVGKTILIQNFSFNPRTITIKVGSTVSWMNNDQVMHTVTSDNFESGSLSNGETYSRIFNEPGVYNYHCSPHPFMIGQIIVTQ